MTDRETCPLEIIGEIKTGLQNVKFMIRADFVAVELAGSTNVLVFTEKSAIAFSWEIFNLLGEHKLPWRQTQGIVLQSHELRVVVENAEAEKTNLTFHVDEEKKLGFVTLPQVATCLIMTKEAAHTLAIGALRLSTDICGNEIYRVDPEEETEEQELKT